MTIFMKKKHFKILILFIIFLVFPLFLSTSMGQPPPPPPQDIPIDGGLLALLLIGITYGGRKIFLDEREKKQLKD